MGCRRRHIPLPKMYIVSLCDILLSLDLKFKEQGGAGSAPRILGMILWTLESNVSVKTNSKH